MEFTVTWTDPGTKEKVTKVARRKYKEDENDFYIRIIEAIKFVHGDDIRVFVKEIE